MNRAIQLKTFILNTFLFFQVVFVFSQNIEFNLNQNWKFRQKGTEKWHTAKVPGTVHTDLYTNKLIPDPFYADNEKKLQWIESEDWEYSTDFICDKKLLANENIELNFDGLDTYAKVYLNNELILDANNMFRSWATDVKNKIKEGKNTLLIVFESAVKKGKLLASQLTYTLPGEEKIFTRKAQYQYGWDFAPRLVTCGIWKPIKLNSNTGVKIKNISYTLPEFTDTTANLEIAVNITCKKAGDYELNYNFTADTNSFKGIIKDKKNISLKAGINIEYITVGIPKPRLWWCNGIGPPTLYYFEFNLRTNELTIDSKKINIGIRKIELVQKKDSIGTSFMFKLNGKRHFIRGANYIPPSVFLPQLAKQDYEEIILQAKSANMNMIRVWGGGVYPDEEFYNLCDKNGILIWQDFMFACAMYPGDTAFVNNIKKEIDEQVQKLSTHPCLALWCGNNEIDEGWNNWGWQKQFKYSKEDSIKIWNNYIDLFHKTIPALVKENSSGIPYITTSPLKGWGKKESLLEGDSHYWGIWWGKEPFENYKTKVGRFMSEYGFQSMPALNTFKSFCDTNDLNLNSKAVKNHQKHAKGYETIKSYLEKDYFFPKEFEKQIYVSQLVQRDGMKIAIEAHRRAKPYCMGTMFWQLNDCWPVTSWSAIDNNKTPKAFYYSLKKLYANIQLSVLEKDSILQFHINSDTVRPINGEIIILVKDFAGKILLERKNKVYIKPNTVQNVFELEKTWLKSFDLNSCYLSFEFKLTNINYKTLHYFVAPKQLKLPTSNITWRYDKNILKIKASSFTKDLFISLNDGSVSLSDNFFDMESGEERQINIQFLNANMKTLKFISLIDVNKE